jgi:hypothetical protein
MTGAVASCPSGNAALRAAVTTLEHDPDSAATGEGAETPGLRGRVFKGT